MLPRIFVGHLGYATACRRLSLSKFSRQPTRLAMVLVCPPPSNRYPLWNPRIVLLASMNSSFVLNASHNVLFPQLGGPMILIHSWSPTVFVLVTEASITAIALSSPSVHFNAFLQLVISCFHDVHSIGRIDAPSSAWPLSSSFFNY